MAIKKDVRITFTHVFSLISNLFYFQPCTNHLYHSGRNKITDNIKVSQGIVTPLTPSRNATIGVTAKSLVAT